MRVLVCGGRDYDNWRVVDRALKALCASHPYEDMVIVQGGAKGADFLAKVWAKYWREEGEDIRQEEYPADWKKHGKAAGYIRNKQMLDEGKPDLVVAFPGGAGTADMIRQAKAAGVEVMEVVDD